MTVLLFAILVVLCWPVALLVLLLWPVLWLLSIPFRVLKIVVEGALALASAVLLAPLRLVRAL